MNTPALSSRNVTDAFRMAMRRMASTVTIVTASDGIRRHGMTMTAVTSLSMDPPALLICVNRSTLLSDILVGARHFCVNVLRHDQTEVSNAFSGTVPPEARFSVDHWDAHASGVDCLGSAQANIVCDKAAALPYGSHLIVIGNIRDVILHEGNGDSRPLLYRDAAYC